MEKKTYTPEELVHIRDMAQAYSLRYPTIKKRNLSQEFGSYVMIETLEGRYKKLSWMITDFLRQEYGRLVLMNGKPSQKTQANLSHVSVDELSKKDKAAVIKRSSQNIDDILEMLPPSLTSHEHALLLLMFKWGLTQKEIGELFRFGESRACQLISLALKKVRKALRESRGKPRRTE